MKPRLIGWQIVHRTTDNPPKGMHSFEIYSLGFVTKWFQKLSITEKPSWRLIPIFEGDVGGPTFPERGHVSLTCPLGHQIRGSGVVVKGISIIEYAVIEIDMADGKPVLDFDFSGTDIDWDSMQPERDENGERLFFCKTGCMVPESELVTTKEPDDNGRQVESTSDQDGSSNEPSES